MLKENNPDASRMSIPRVYLVSCCICDVYICGNVCLEACDYRAFVARMTRHGHWVGWTSALLDVDGWKKLF